MRIFKNIRAAAGMQYATVLGLIAVVMIVAVTVLGGSVKNLFSNVSNRLTNVGGDTASSNSSTPSAPTSGTSCKALRQAGQTNDGVYTIDADGNGPDAPLSMYCNMTWDGGGWTLALVQDPAVNWSALTPSKTTIPTNPLAASGNVLHYDHVLGIGATEMMVLSSNGTTHRIIKLYYSNGNPTIQVGYRRFTERSNYDSNVYTGDAPHTGTTRSGCGHTTSLCTTGNWSGFKNRNNCDVDATNSHPSWGNCPGNGTNNGSSSDCWFFGGGNIASLPSISTCPAGSQAPFATYTVNASVSSPYTTQLWVR